METTEAEVKLPPKLVPVFTGEADVRGAYGGRGSGKTRNFALMTAIRAYMWDMAGRSGIILCCRQFMNSLEDSSLEEIKMAIRETEWLEPFFDIGERYIRTKSGRISYSFIGLDRNINSVKSKSRLLLAWVDEAEPVTDDAWTKLIPTLREEDSELWVTWNPESKYAPVHNRFRLSDDPRYKVVEMNWRDNPWFPNILKRQMERDKIERPDEVDHIWEGGFRIIVEGAYYASLLATAEREGRLSEPVPHRPDLPVYVSVDIGIGDDTSLIFAQRVGGYLHIIDHYATNGQPASHYVEVINSKPYTIGRVYLPHDAESREWVAGQRRIDVLRSLGLKNLQVVGKVPVDDGINAVRALIPTMRFDSEKCDHLIEALRNYRREQFTDDRRAFKPTPRHDWTSHDADSMRYLCLGLEPETAPVSIPRYSQQRRRPTVGAPSAWTA